MDEITSANIPLDVMMVLLGILGAGVFFWFGRVVGKTTASAKVLVLEERIKHKESFSHQQSLEIEQSKERLEQLQDDNRDKDMLLTELNVQISASEKESKEKLAFVLAAKEQLKSEFSMVAQTLLDEKSEKFTALNRNSLSQVLLPLKDQLTSFSKQVSDGYDKDLRDRVSLLKEISDLKTINARMSDEALNLTRALKGDNKLQGNWGEMVLARVLEMSGLQLGREYFLQPSYKQPNGTLLRPDAVIQLPGDKSVIVDSKVSLKDWEEVVAAEDEALAELPLKKHVDSIKNHIKNLSGKQYEHIPGITSLDYVLMFVPIEAAFIKALEMDSELYGLANDKNIMLVCPSTLLVTLKAIRYGWQHDRQNRNALEIAQRAGALHDQFVLFVEALEDVGDKVSKASLAYDTAHKRLTSGKGSLVNRVVQLEQLGAKTKKNLMMKEQEAPFNHEGGDVTKRVLEDSDAS